MAKILGTIIAALLWVPTVIKYAFLVIRASIKASKLHPELVSCQLRVSSKYWAKDILKFAFQYWRIHFDKTRKDDTYDL